MILVDLIRNNCNWEDILAEKRVAVKKKGDLAIFNYSAGADFSDPLVRECRGVILDGDQNVVCRGFDKFGNYFEDYADNIDWNSARVQQKIDGSIVKLYYFQGEWRWATNGMIDASDAPTKSEGNFLELIHKADNYSKIAFSHLDTEFTYIFELVSPYNRIVIEYPTTHLYHIGSRNRISGKEKDLTIGIEKPKQYSLKSMEECLAYIKEMNAGGLTDEGLVVVDGNYHRIKIKTEEYFALHRTMTGHFSAEKAIELLLSVGYEGAVEQFPQYDVELAWYLYQYNSFLRRVKETEVYAVNLYKEAEGNRRIVAEKLRGNVFACFGFARIDGKKLEWSAKKIADTLVPFEE